jgi:mannosyltransferase
MKEARRTTPLSLVTHHVSLITLLLLAFALRIHLLGAQSFWNDEGSSYVQATRSFADIAYHAERDIHPPLYYWLLAAWRALAGESEYALRMLSVFVSLLSVATTAALGRRLFGSVGAVAAALFVALNSFSIYYAQEARMYALLALWGVLSLWLLAGMLRGNTNRSVLALGIVNAAGLYTQYAYFYVLLTQAVVVAVWWVGKVIANRSKGNMHVSDEARLVPTLIAIVIAQAVALLLFLPWLPTALTQIGGWPNTGQSVESAQALNVILNWLIYGVTAQGEVLAVVWILALFGLTIIPTRVGTGSVMTQADAMNVVPTTRVRGGAPFMASVRKTPELWTAFLPAIWVVVSVGVFMAQGLFRENNLKFLLPAQIGMALWMGRGAAVLWTAAFVRGEGRARDVRRWVLRIAGGAAALLIAAAMWRGLDPIYHDPAYQRADYRAIARLAEAELSTVDAIILNGPNQAEVFNYYYRGEAQVIGLPAGLGGDDNATEAELIALTRSMSMALNRAYGQVFAVLWGDRERDPNRIVEGLLDNTLYSAGETWYGDVRLARYFVRTSALEIDMRIVSAMFDGGRIYMQAHYTSEAEVGGVVFVRLTWLNRTEAPIPQRYKVFVQLLNSEGVLVAQHDSEPSGGASPTNEWQLGTRITDNHAILVPPDAPPGAYTLIAGMYAVDPPNARLTLSDGSDHVVLGQITVR